MPLTVQYIKYGPNALGLSIAQLATAVLVSRNYAYYVVNYHLHIV